MIDSHFHFSHKKFNQIFIYLDLKGNKYIIIPNGTREDLIKEMKSRGVKCVIDPSISVDYNENLLKICDNSDGFIRPAVGNHPTKCIYSKFKDFKMIKEISKNDKIVAIGETGLDYHLERRKQYRIKQKIWFLWQINLAYKLNLPLILHIRLADKDAISILRRNSKKIKGGVVHCFCGGLNEAKIYTEELGLCLGIGGMLLRKTEFSETLEQAVINIPIKYLILETDGPYVKPEKTEDISNKKWTKVNNTSLILPALAQKIAELKGMKYEEVLKITEENTIKLFNLHKYLE